MSDPQTDKRDRQEWSAAPLALDMVAAVVGRLDEALLPLRGLLAASNRQAGLAGYLTRAYHRQTIEEMRSKGYRTNDIVQMADEIAKALRDLRLTVNGIGINLEVRELLVVFVLARQARTRARAGSLGASLDTEFMSVASLLDEIDRVKAEAGLEELWRNVIDTDIHKAISSLRRKLVRAGFNRNLIEGKRGVGYRLSTPSWNLISAAHGGAGRAPAQP